MYTFENYYKSYKRQFITKHGQAKYDKIAEKVINSGKIAYINGLSIQAKIHPTHKDFSAAIHEIPYFIFSGADTVAMAEFIAIKYWNEEINSVFGFCTDHQLFFKAEAILKHWGLRI